MCGRLRLTDTRKWWRREVQRRLQESSAAILNFDGAGPLSSSPPVEHSIHQRPSMSHPSEDPHGPLQCRTD